eukprot:CAMPEP_0195060318 /NCGR_PEP_ID=MMETSP0448-20130528/7611_1 /TAXON_ID=66468 /ORGANISM="Heterocapsa triquestra, Strain CCMP 448" /LENGTH=178 /DNA_ID=CAMNT_0040090715 /DNA_START=74 /DNA_END=610 /DNA_ORIENTATION=+
MGASLVKLWHGTKNASVLMLGLDAAGKTTILYRLKLEQVVTTLPTTGFNVEKVEHDNVNFTVWDVGGQDKIRRGWRNYCLGGSQALIYVVDCSDRERIEDAWEELERMLREEGLRGAPLLVLANKTDLPDAMTATDVADRLKLHISGRDRQWIIQPTCAISGHGLAEGLSWLAGALAA